MVGEIGIEIIAGIALFALGSLVAVGAMHWRWLRKSLAWFGVHIKVPRPQLDLDLIFDVKTDTTRVFIKNAGDQAAFNVYCFLFEIYHASENGNYKISSLGPEGIKAGVLAPGEKITFDGKHVQFDGCNVTCEQEIWVEYTDEVKRHYRTRIIPPTPRGDDLKVEPPAQIQKRMPRLPSLNFEGSKNYESIRKGKEGLQGLHYI